MLTSDCCTGHTLEVHKTSLTASVGDSVRFSSSYSVSSPFYNWPSIEWSFGYQTILYYSIDNGSLNSNGRVIWSTGSTAISPLYEGRLEFHPVNASLTLKDLKHCDEGTYQITFLSFENIIKKKISLKVHATPGSYCGTESETEMLLAASDTLKADRLQNPEKEAAQCSTITFWVLISVLVVSTFLCFCILCKCILPSGKKAFAPKTLLKQGLWQVQRSHT
ncbi:uncharacterized protein LOC108698214 isoform X2 [Xenopus laevis]|nr:uncharacterized protein LOC108698214 isoform X2 [Xenopus laevis]